MSVKVSAGEIPRNVAWAGNMVQTHSMLGWLGLVYLGGFSTGSEFAKQNATAFGAFLLIGGLVGVLALGGFEATRSAVSRMISRFRIKR